VVLYRPNIGRQQTALIDSIGIVHRIIAKISFDFTSFVLSYSGKNLLYVETISNC